MHNLPSTRKKAATAIARGSSMTLAKECLANEKVKGYIIKKVALMVQSEIKLMCNFQSVLKSKSSDDLKHFKWEMIFDELQKKAPVFLCFMMSATKTRNPRSNRIPVICMCTAILLKYRFKQLNLVQKVISLLLYSGNCSKEVSISICTILE